MKRKAIIATGISAAVVLALGGGLAYSASSNRPLVGVATASTARLDVTVSAPGKLVPAHTSGVYPPTAGTLASVAVRDGEAVEAGQVLAQLETAPLKLALAQAKAAYAHALAQSEGVNNAVPTGTERSAAGDALAAARSQADTAGKNYADYLASYNAADPATQATMISTLRSLKSARSTANAAVKTAQGTVARLKRAGQVGKARAAASQSISAAAQADRLAEHNVAKATLTAPFAGTVSLAGTTEPGAGVTPGVAAFTVVDPQRMEFQAAVNETDIAGVQTGQSATVTLDAFTDPFTGKVTAVKAAPELTSTGWVAFGVRIELSATSERLFQGMSGSADIVTSSIADALVVPVEAVVNKGSAHTVFVLDTSGMVHAHPVSVGASTDTLVQITDGLVAGDQVVTTGASTLADGQLVRTK